MTVEATTTTMRIGSNNRRHNAQNTVVGVLERPAIATGAETTPNMDLHDATNPISHQVYMLKTQPATLTTAACSQPTLAHPLLSRNDTAMLPPLLTMLDRPHPRTWQ